MDGEAPDEEKPMPDVPPPDYINACKAVLLNFGNLQIDEERGDLSTQIKLIASEAEVVATRIYGKGMTAREQQVRFLLSILICTHVLYETECIILCRRTVHGKSKQLQSLIWKHLRLKLNAEENLHRGPILMPPTTFCQDSDRMARCALEGSNTILKVIIILLLFQCIVVMYFLRNQLLFYDTWYCIYASISSSHIIL